MNFKKGQTVIYPNGDRLLKPGATGIIVGSLADMDNGYEDYEYFIKFEPDQFNDPKAHDDALTLTMYADTVEICRDEKLNIV